MVHLHSAFQAFFDELKRRRVFRVAAAYVVGAIFVLEAGNLVFQGLALPEWPYRTLTMLVLLGFPVVLVLSWVYQWTSAGIRREDETPDPAAVAQVAAGGERRASVRAFAFVALGMVIVLVGMGLTVPYLNSRAEHQTTQQAQREGVTLAANDGTARLAVLPFMSLTGEDDSGFADGLAEDVTATLTQLGGIDVVSRTTSESYRDSDMTAGEIGAEIGAGLIVEGTIRRAGDRVRVTVQLIDTRTDRHLWANSYDRVVSGDVLGTQAELAQDIVTAIEAVVFPGRADQAESRRLAFDIASEGDALLRRAEPAYDAAAEDLFTQSLDADSANPVAHAGLAQTQIARAQNGQPAVLDSAAHHADLAVALAPELADAHAAHAFVLMVQGKMDSATIALRRAVELDVSGEAFETEWQERIRMISPEALAAVREAIMEARRRSSQTRPDVPGPSVSAPPPGAP